MIQSLYHLRQPIGISKIAKLDNQKPNNVDPALNTKMDTEMTAWDNSAGLEDYKNNYTGSGRYIQVPHTSENLEGRNPGICCR